MEKNSHLGNTIRRFETEVIKWCEALMLDERDSEDLDWVVKGIMEEFDKVISKVISDS